MIDDKLKDEPMKLAEEDSRSFTDQRCRAAALARLLAPAEADAAKGRTRPAEEFFKQFRLARGIQRSGQ